MDHWKGTEGEHYPEVAKVAKDKFLERFKEEISNGKIVVEEGDLRNPIFKGHLYERYHNGLDVVFIDADHRFDPLVDDIVLATSLLKYNGLLCGHDFGKASHPYVRRAVERMFGKGNYEVVCGSLWRRK